MQETIVALTQQEGFLSVYLYGSIFNSDFVFFRPAGSTDVSQGHIRMFILANESIF